MKDRPGSHLGVVHPEVAQEAPSGWQILGISLQPLFDAKAARPKGRQDLARPDANSFTREPFSTRGKKPLYQYTYVQSGACVHFLALASF